MNELTTTIIAALLGFLTSSLIMLLFFNGDFKTVAYCGLGSCIYVILRLLWEW